MRFEVHEDRFSSDLVGFPLIRLVTPKTYFESYGRRCHLVIKIFLLPSLLLEIVRLSRLVDGSSVSYHTNRLILKTQSRMFHPFFTPFLGNFITLPLTS